MRKLTVLVFVLSFTCNLVFATQYFFTSVEDHYYENPINWSPSYPGAIIGSEDTVVFIHDVHFNGFDLTIRGTMEVGPGVGVSSSEGTLFIEENGMLDNYGEIKVKAIINRGDLINRFSSLIHIFDYHAEENAYTQNAGSSKFITISDLRNEGQFDNYYLCQVGGSFYNNASFHQIKNSQLVLRGDYFLPDGSILTESRKSIVKHRTTEMQYVNGALIKKIQ